MAEETEKSTSKLLRLARVTLQEAFFMQSLIVAQSDMDKGAKEVEKHVQTMFALPADIRVKPSDIFPCIWGSALRVQQGSSP